MRDRCCDHGVRHPAAKTCRLGRHRRPSSRMRSYRLSLRAWPAPERHKRETISILLRGLGRGVSKAYHATDRNGLHQPLHRVGMINLRQHQARIRGAWSNAVHSDTKGHKVLRPAARHHGHGGLHDECARNVETEALAGKQIITRAHKKI